MEPEQVQSPEAASQSILSRKWSADRVLGISAISISFMTFLVLIYQTQIIREQQLLSALPYLHTGNIGFSAPSYAFYLKNEGVGPAFIEDIVIKYKGEAWEGKDLAEFLMAANPIVNQLPNIYYSNIKPGMLIPAGGSLSVIEVREDHQTSVKFAEILSNYEKEGYGFELIYSSVYGEKWRITDQSIAPEKL
jgi:hypothetical protein